MTTRASKCSICFHPIGIDAIGWDCGHNAQTINYGLCCEACNETVVIKARLQQFIDLRTHDKQVAK